jgi:XRE family transcriptional regulator, fatty acid utilization regulator
MASEKIFIGPKLRELRQTNNLTQAEMARQLSVSASYVNLLERNQRSASLKFLISLSDTFNLNWRDIVNSDASVTLSDLRQIASDHAFAETIPDIEELRAASEHCPNLVKGFINIYNAYRTFGERLAEQNEAIAAFDSTSFTGEQAVHDFFRRNNNHFEALESAAETLCAQHIPDRQEIFGALRSYLENNLNVRVRQVRAEILGKSLRHYDPKSSEILLSDGLDHVNRVFQLAHMVALIGHADLIKALMPESLVSNPQALARCRIELANYFAAAVMMPYESFIEEAERVSYDMDRLAALFSSSYEQVCHRLTTMQRPGKRGIPFFFLRIDRGGNVSKRFNITSIELARYGGACPRLDVHYCFRVPGRIMTQVVEMPDNSRYLTINRTVERPSLHYSTEDKRLAVSLGCPVEFANKTVYGQKLDPNATRFITEIGINCRLCPRKHCEQRAHEPFVYDLKLDENRRGITHLES